MENEELLNILKKLEETEKLIREYLGKNKPNTPTTNTLSYQQKRSRKLTDFIPNANIEEICKNGLRDANNKGYWIDIVVPEYSNFKMRYFLRYKAESGWLYYLKNEKDNNDSVYPRFLEVCYKYEVPEEWFTKIISDYNALQKHN